MTCSACGAPVPPEARFCPTCGHAVVARPDERRIATVLFADLVGFTTFSESADPESVKNLVDSCFERLVEDVDAFGGQVDKIVGDAIVALFGAPVAHEDDPERAVRAALRMQETLARLRVERGVDAAIRIGVNTGEVLVGALRAGGDYTAMGDVVNTANRLQVVAPPGDVLVGPATFAATRHAFRYERLGPLIVKGREAPVEAWVAREALTLPGQRHTPAKSPLVGRRIELDVLGTTLRAAVERRRAHFVLLSGEAGVGKTRLTRELGAEACERHGATVLHTHCAPFGEANPLFPVAVALRAATGLDGITDLEAARAAARDAVSSVTRMDDDDPELGRVTEGLLHLMELTGPAPGVDPTRAREDAIRALLTYFAALGERSLLVLTVADLHWADDVVLDLMDRLLTGLRDRPFVLAATARPELEERWSPRPGRHNAAVLNLEPLDPEAGAAMAEALLGDVSPELVSLLVERSGGNPFFIEELAAMISETGEHTAAGHAADLPVTLRGLVTARLDALDPVDRSTLDDCAVVGTTGPRELVTALALDPAAAGASLERLAARDLIELDGETFAFRNELTREVAYGTLTKAERARRHARLTEVLAHPASDTNRIESLLGALTHHYGLAVSLVAELGHVDGVPDDMAARGTRFMLDAVHRADAEENWSVLRGLASRTLKLVPASDPRHVEVVFLRARARAGLRDCEGARQDLAVVARHADATGDDHLAARVLVLRGDVLYKENDLVGSRGVLDEAVERWRALGDADGLADALRQRAQTAMYSGDLEAAERDASDALERFRSIGNRRGEAWGLQTLAFVSFFGGAMDKTEARLNEAGSLFADLGDWGGLGWSLGLLAWLRYTEGRFEEAERLARQMRDDFVSTTDRWALAMMDVLLADIALWRGRLTTALQVGTAARDTMVELDDAWGQLNALVPVARSELGLGHLDAALAVSDEMRPIGQRFTGSPTALLVPLLRSQLFVHAGDPRAADAVREILPGTEMIVTIGPEYATATGLAALQRGAVSEAVAALESGHGDDRWYRGNPSAGAALALAYAADGRPDDAIALYDEIVPSAVSFLDRLQATVALGLARLQTGAVDDALATLDDAIDQADATESKLDQALTRLARSVGLAAVGRAEAAAARAETEQLLQRIHVPAPGWSRAFTLAAGAPIGA